ncbi:MAG: permease-like cell division protein FtsX, partial [Bdellovibrionales bacterium]|nr:permease-like cell division protein FtsX [Bdellovibrionales bacterium]
MNFNIQKTFLRFTTVLISTAGLALVLSFFLFFKNINRVVSVWGEIEKVTVYVDSEASKGEVEKLKNQIQALSEVKEVNFISKEEAIDDFKAQMAGYIQDFKKDVNLMQVVPSYFEVSVELDSSFESTVKKLNLLSQKIGKLDFVEEVSYGSIWIDKYSKLIDYISSLAGFIGIILITSTFLVISNLIKSNLYQRSKEIEVLEMIGATKSYIRKPFLKEGAVMSFLGG